MDWLQWLAQLAQDADPERDGFQARLLYVVLNLAVPVLLGLGVGALANLAGRLRRRVRRRVAPR